MGKSNPQVKISAAAIEEVCAVIASASCMCTMMEPTGPTALKEREAYRRGVQNMLAAADHAVRRLNHGDPQRSTEESAGQAGVPGAEPPAVEEGS